MNESSEYRDYEKNSGYFENLFGNYPANEYIELDAYQEALIARETLSYTKLLNAKDIFKNKGVK